MKRFLAILGLFLKVKKPGEEGSKEGSTILVLLVFDEMYIIWTGKRKTVDRTEWNI